MTWELDTVTLHDPDGLVLASEPVVLGVELTLVSPLPGPYSIRFWAAGRLVCEDGPFDLPPGTEMYLSLDTKKEPLATSDPAGDPGR